MNTEHETIDTSVPIGSIEVRMDALRRGEQTAVTKKALSRLGFVHLRYKGYSLPEAARIVGVTDQTGYNWQRIWNESGLDEIVPTYSGGRKSRLSDDQVRDAVRHIGGNAMTTAEARDYIAEAFGTEYSVKQVHIILAGSGLMHISRKASGIRTGEDAPSEGRMVWILPEGIVRMSARSAFNPHRSRTGPSRSSSPSPIPRPPGRGPIRSRRRGGGWRISPRR